MSVDNVFLNQTIKSIARAMLTLLARDFDKIFANILTCVVDYQLDVSKADRAN